MVQQGTNITVILRAQNNGHLSQVISNPFEYMTKQFGRTNLLYTFNGELLTMCFGIF